MGKDVIIALDFPTGKEALEFLQLFKEKKPFVKIGMELFYSEGPDIVRKVKERGHKVFLDLKLHDIPNTVKGAFKALSNLQVDMLNLHAAGTKKMMQAALEAFEGKERPLIIAVTQLTSTCSEELQKELLINTPMEETVLSYASLAKEAGLDGIVCSPLEVKVVKEQLGKGFLSVTPGIRTASSMKDDQARITTPLDAKKVGSDYIVVGRPITKAENPVLEYNKICKDFLG